MNKFIFVLLLLLSSVSLHAQMRMSVNFSMLVDTIRVRHYTFDERSLELGVHALKVPVRFNDEVIIDRKMLDTLNDGLTQVIGIDYAYTQYKDKKTQDDLNKKRLLELYLIAPNMFNQNMTKWRFIEQLGFTRDEDAKKLFHGFIIKYVRVSPYKASSPTMIKKDILDKMKTPNDSLILNVFSRNPLWSKELIVADFTGSMSPYYIDLLAWFCLQNYKEKTTFAFFNDGDGKADDLKTLGSTGGVHQFRTNNIDTIAKYVYETIKAGDGGDVPENDIEAILKALDQNPTVKELILIADNWSDMKDYNLRGRVTKPVHILLCGTDYGINLQYLNLAMETKGSVHTLNQDLDNLYKLNEGSTFTLNGQSFIVRNRRIEKQTKL